MVSTSPEEAIAAGAEWRADAGDWQEGGGTLTGLTAGTHTVEFKRVAVWAKPDSLDVTIRAGKTANITRMYIGQ